MQRSYNGQYIVLPSRWSGFDSHSLLHSQKGKTALPIRSLTKWGIENQLFQLDRGLAVHWQTTGITPVNDAEPNRKGNKVQAE